jgi:hypothetical protein
MSTIYNPNKELQEKIDQWRISHNKFKKIFLEDIMIKIEKWREN